MDRTQTRPGQHVLWESLQVNFLEVRVVRLHPNEIRPPRASDFNEIDSRIEFHPQPTHVPLASAPGAFGIRSGERIVDTKIQKTGKCREPAEYLRTSDGEAWTRKARGIPIDVSRHDRQRVVARNVKEREPGASVCYVRPRREVIRFERDEVC